MPVEIQTADARGVKAPELAHWAPGLLALLLVGCGAGIGPSRIPPGRFSYNQAIVNSQNEQMLLNLVRLRYQDTPLFLDIDSVVASFGMSSGLKVSPGVVSTSGSPSVRSLGAEADVSWEDRPTITYNPLQGDEFAKRLLAPLQPEQLLLLSQSGWGLERLLICCVQQVNDLPNAMSIGGVAPVRITHFEQFQRVAALMRELQEEGYIALSPRKDDPTKVVLGAGPVPSTKEAMALATEAVKLLGLKKGAQSYLLVAGQDTRDTGEIMVRGRSLLGVMAFLAETVDVPAEHKAKGLVRQPLGADGKPFDWKLVSHGLFQVHSGSAAPEGTFVKVLHRGTWFWISDNDLESKATFTLVNQLFSLQSASSKGGSPILTLPGR